MKIVNKIGDTLILRDGRFQITLSFNNLDITDFSIDKIKSDYEIENILSESRPIIEKLKEEVGIFIQKYSEQINDKKQESNYYKMFLKNLGLTFVSSFKPRPTNFVDVFYQKSTGTYYMYEPLYSTTVTSIINDIKNNCLPIKKVEPLNEYSNNYIFLVGDEGTKFYGKANYLLDKVKKIKKVRTEMKKYEDKLFNEDLSEREILDLTEMLFSLQANLNENDSFYLLLYEDNLEDIVNTYPYEGFVFVEDKRILDEILIQQNILPIEKHKEILNYSYLNKALLPFDCELLETEDKFFTKEELEKSIILNLVSEIRENKSGTNTHNLKETLYGLSAEDMPNRTINYLKWYLSSYENEKGVIDNDAD